MNLGSSCPNGFSTEHVAGITDEHSQLDSLITEPDWKFFLKIKYRAASSSKICKSLISSPMISCTPFEISSLLDSPRFPEFLGYLRFPHPQGILSLALDGETPHLASCILGAAFTLLTVRRLKR